MFNIQFKQLTTGNYKSTLQKFKWLVNLHTYKFKKINLPIWVGHFFSSDVFNVSWLVNYSSNLHSGSCQGKVIGQRQELDPDTAFFTFLLPQARIQSKTFLLVTTISKKFCLIFVKIKSKNKAVFLCSGKYSEIYTRKRL